MGLPPIMRETAITSMNKRIEESDFPINQWFFSTLSFLHVTPGSEKESVRKQREAINPVIWSAIFSAVAKKEPEARAETVQTLLGNGQNISTPEVKQQMASLLKHSFLDLDSRSQEDDLVAQWDRLKSPKFLPVLQKLARFPLDSPDDFEVGSYTRQGLKGIALKRWYELDPEGAHREIVTQIGSATPTLAAQSISFLPEEQFPQFEPLWAQALLGTTSQMRERGLGSLLVRFGTGTATKQMIAKADAVDNLCDGHIVALAYLARFSPNEAKPRLAREFSGKCSDDLLKSISELTHTPVLNHQAVENLNSQDPQIVLDALQYLTSYGRKEDEAPLWRSFVGWTTAYEAKASLLDHQGNDWNKSFARSEMGEELGYALINNQGWFADSGLIARVLQRCVGDRMCKDIKAIAEEMNPPYQVLMPDLTTSDDLSEPHIFVARYHCHSLKLFEAKISQFPPGSKFVFEPYYQPSNSDERKLDEQVREILKKHGLSLEISQD
jgi:hypothetical protein